MSEQSLQLVHEFTYQVACGPAPRSRSRSLRRPPVLGDDRWLSRRATAQGKAPRIRQRLDAYRPGWLHADGRPGPDRDGRWCDPLRPLLRSGRGQRKVETGRDRMRADRVHRPVEPLPLGAGDGRPAVRLGQPDGVCGTRPVAPRWSWSAGLQAPGLPTILNESVSNSRRPPRGYQGATPWWTPSTQARQEANGLEGV